MTTEDQDAVIGQLVRERRDLRAQQELLTAKLFKAGELLASVAQVLQSRPEYWHLSKGATAVKMDDAGAVTVLNAGDHREFLTGQFPTREEIAGLLRERDRIIGRLAEIDAHLRPLGI